jgi:Tfp pilus assembly protein PilE
LRSYWLTQYILTAVFWGYLIVSLIALALALWLPKGKGAKTVVALIVLGVVAILPIQGFQEYVKEGEAMEAHQARLQEAQALFAQRCKTAGEKIHRTAANVDGLLLMKLRPDKINLSNQYELDDPYGRDFGGEEYISSFMWGRNPDGTFTRNHGRGTYKFVEVADPQTKAVQRYRAVRVPRPSGEAFDIRLTPDKSTDRISRYGVNWADLSTREDRDHWIAGSLLQVVDLQTNEVIAERIGYMFDSGLGDQGGGRAPWAFAAWNACPPFDKSASGNPVKSSRSRAFVLRVLTPTQGE